MMTAKLMNTSWIEVNPESGSRILKTFYDPVLNDYERAISQALDYHGLRSGEIAVLAIPCRQKIRTEGRKYNEQKEKNFQSTCCCG